MSIVQMRDQLLKWNTHWKKETISKWRDKQVVAIYTKELEKYSKSPKQSFKQLSFF